MDHSLGIPIDTAWSQPHRCAQLSALSLSALLSTALLPNKPKRGLTLELQLALTWISQHEHHSTAQHNTA